MLRFCGLWCMEVGCRAKWDFDVGGEIGEVVRCGCWLFVVRCLFDDVRGIT